MKLSIISQVCKSMNKEGLQGTYFKILNKLYNNNLEHNYYKYEEQCSNTRQVTIKDQDIKISIVVPIYNTPNQFLCDMIDSVRKQSYANWELCIADGGKSIENKKLIEEYLKLDSRIVYKDIEENLGIAGNTNVAINLATGEYISFLDHDDILMPQALEEVVSAIKQHGADVIYTDEDKIDEEGKRRFCPHIKSDWSLRMLLSYNYICHFTVIKKELIDTYGPVKEGYEGSQDYEFILRMCSNAKTIHHIPRVLYHWRVNANSTASNIENKNYALESGQRVLKDYFNNQGIDVDIEQSRCIGANHIYVKTKEDIKINVVIYGSKKNISNIHNLYEKLKNTAITNIIFHNIAEGVYEDATGNLLNTIDYQLKIKQCLYTLVIEENTVIKDITFIDDLVQEFTYENIIIVSPLLLSNDHTVRSLGLAVNEGEISTIYKGYNASQLGYMGRLEITQNVFGVEPIVFLTYSEYLLDEIKEVYIQPKQWIKLLEENQAKVRLTTVVARIKILNRSSIRWKDVKTSLANDKFFPIIRYMND
nr:glycosyltransferase [uncultured Cellulosilyticum sp.]